MGGFIDLINYLPNQIFSGKNHNLYLLNPTYDEMYINLSYMVGGYNNSKREHSLTIPRFISKNERTFEVLGLLQAEMGKTQNGSLSFANNQPKIINYVLKWFEKELELDKESWKWSIKLNINDPTDLDYKKKVERKVIDYWLNKTKIKLGHSYPKNVTYIKNTDNKKLKLNDYGTLVLEYKSNLFSQIIKKFVRKITYEKILNCENKLIQCYIRSIIAGEGTVDFWKLNKRYRVYISASKEEEKDIFYRCLKKLNISSIKYKGDKLIISKRENLVQLLNQRLMTLHPKKYAKFLNMMKQYPNIEKETNYFKPKGQNVWNKYSQEKIDEVINLHKKYPYYPCWKVAELSGISTIKVNRIFKEHRLGRRQVLKITGDKVNKILELYKQNPKIKVKDVSKLVEVSEQAVVRIRTKFKLKTSYSKNDWRKL